MLGWEIVIQRGAIRHPFEMPPAGELVATWLTGPGGTRWLDELVESKSAIGLGGDGYPCRYALTVGALLVTLKSGTPRAHGPPVIGEDYYLPGNWTGANRIELEVLQAADPTEILLVEAWDQS